MNFIHSMKITITEEGMSSSLHIAKFRIDIRSISKLTFKVHLLTKHTFCVTCNSQHTCQKLSALSSYKVELEFFLTETSKSLDVVNKRQLTQ